MLGGSAVPLGVGCAVAGLPGVQSGVGVLGAGSTGWVWPVGEGWRAGVGTGIAVGGAVSCGGSSVSSGSSGTGVLDVALAVGGRSVGVGRIACVPTTIAVGVGCGGTRVGAPVGGDVGLDVDSADGRGVAVGLGSGVGVSTAGLRVGAAVGTTRLVGGAGVSAGVGRRITVARRRGWVGSGVASHGVTSWVACSRVTTGTAVARPTVSLVRGVAVLMLVVGVMPGSAVSRRVGTSVGRVAGVDVLSGTRVGVFVGFSSADWLARGACVGLAATCPGEVDAGDGVSGTSVRATSRVSETEVSVRETRGGFVRVSASVDASPEAAVAARVVLSEASTVAGESAAVAEMTAAAVADP